MYLTRYSGPSWRGFQVRVPGFPTKLYSIRTLGLQRARSLATAHRDRLLARSRYAAARFVHQRGTRNRSGVVGVCRCVIWKVYRYKRRIYRYPKAVWVAQAALVSGQSRNRAFSVNRWGERGARARAIAWRKEAVAEILGKPVSRVFSRGRK